MLLCELTKSTQQAPSPWFVVPVVTLVAAIVGMTATLLAAAATAAYADRRAIAARFDEIRGAVARWRASGQYGRYVGGEETRARSEGRLDDANRIAEAAERERYELFITNSQELRSHLGGLRSSSPVIASWLARPVSDLGSDVHDEARVNALYDALDDIEREYLGWTRRWWLARPRVGGLRI